MNINKVLLIISILRSFRTRIFKVIDVQMTSYDNEKAVIKMTISVENGIKKTATINVYSGVAVVIIDNMRTTVSLRSKDLKKGFRLAIYRLLKKANNANGMKKAKTTENVTKKTNSANDTKNMITNENSTTKTKNENDDKSTVSPNVDIRKFIDDVKHFSYDPIGPVNIIEYVLFDEYRGVVIAENMFTKNRYLVIVYRIGRYKPIEILPLTENGIEMTLNGIKTVNDLIERLLSTIPNTIKEHSRAFKIMRSITRDDVDIDIDAFIAFRKKKARVNVYAYASPREHISVRPTENGMKLTITRYPKIKEKKRITTTVPDDVMSSILRLHEAICHLLSCKQVMMTLDFDEDYVPKPKDFEKYYVPGIKGTRIGYFEGFKFYSPSIRIRDMKDYVMKPLSDDVKRVRERAAQFANEITKTKQEPETTVFTLTFNKKNELIIRGTKAYSTDRGRHDDTVFIARVNVNDRMITYYVPTKEGFKEIGTVTSLECYRYSDVDVFDVLKEYVGNIIKITDDRRNDVAPSTKIEFYDPTKNTFALIANFEDMKLLRYTRDRDVFKGIKAEYGMLPFALLAIYFEFTSKMLS